MSAPFKVAPPEVTLVSPLTVSLSPNSAPPEVTLVSPLTVVAPITDRLPVIPVVPLTVSLSPNSAPLEVTVNPPDTDKLPPVIVRL